MGFLLNDIRVFAQTLKKPPWNVCSADTIWNKGVGALEYTGHSEVGFQKRKQRRSQIGY